jgi:CrcB protein
MYKPESRLESRPAQTRADQRVLWRDGKLGRIPWLTLSVIAAGGMIGALARQGLWAVFPHLAGAFNWTTLGINVTGCALIGALMTAIAEVRHAHRLTGPFLGVGVLGGFTTFSTYIVEIQASITHRAPQTGLAYLAATLAAALLAVYAGATLTRLLSRWHRKERS